MDVGFLPNIRDTNYVEPLALYLALYRHVNGAGAPVPFPGAMKNYFLISTDSSQDVVARAAIYLSVVKPGEADGEAFNVGDSAEPGSWTRKWPILAEYFGLQGTGPAQDGWGNPDAWWSEHQDQYGDMCREYGLQPRTISAESWQFFKVPFTLLDRDREASLDKIRSLGFVEEVVVGQGYCLALDRLAEARYIPSRKAYL